MVISLRITARGRRQRGDYKLSASFVTFVVVVLLRFIIRFCRVVVVADMSLDLPTDLAQDAKKRVAAVSGPYCEGLRCWLFYSSTLYT